MRWKLTNKHYLNVPGEEWAQMEVDRLTGKQVRKRYSVPRYLDPEDPSCWTKKWGSGADLSGEIIVCHEGKGEAGDITFVGPPTPDMEPLDEEAVTLSQSMQADWAIKTDVTMSNDEAIHRLLSNKLGEAVASGGSNKSLEDAMQKLVDMQAKLIEALTSGVAAPATRRV